MNQREARSAYHQAKYDERSSKIFFVECTLIAVILGLALKSWAWGLGGYVGMILLLQIKTMQLLLAIFFIIVWTVIGWAIGKNFGLLPSIFAGFIAFFISLGIHFGALSWIDDFTYRGD